MSYRPLRLLPLALLGLLLNLCPAWAQDFDKLDDRLTLAGGRSVEGRIKNRVPVPANQDIVLRVQGAKTGQSEQTYPRARVLKIEYRGDRQIARALKQARAGKVEEAFNMLRQLDVGLPNWRPKDPARLEIGKAWGKVLVQNKLADRAVGVFKALRQTFPQDAVVKQELESALEFVAKESYQKRDFASYKRLITELEQLNPGSSALRALNETFDRDFRAYFEQGQAAEKAKNPRLALDRYESAYRMKPKHPELRKAVQRLRKIYQRFHYGETTRVIGFDPVNNRSPAERRVQQFIYSGLVRHVRDKRALVETSYALELARSVRLSADGRRLLIKLRKDSLWADGKPLSASDVLATVQAMVSRKTDNRDAVLARLINLKKSRVRSNDSLVLSLNFSTPRPRMILDFPILPARLLGTPPALKKRSEIGRKPIGAGPFVFEQRSGNDIILSLNKHFKTPDSSAETAILSEVRVTSFADQTTARTRLENEQIDLLTSLHPADVIRLEASGQFRVRHIAMNEVTFLALNHRRSVIGGRTGFYLRKGLNLAINRSKLLREQYSSGRGKSAHRLITGPFPRGSWAYNEEIKGYDFNASLARQAFRQSRQSNVTLRLIHPPDPIVTAICSVMKKQLQEAGEAINLKIRLVKLTPALFQKALDQRAFDIAYCRYVYDRPILDIEPLLADQETDKGGRNYMGYRHPELAKLFDLLRLTDLWTKIRAYNHEIHRHLHEHAVMIPLWQLDNYFAYSLRVRDLEVHPVHLFGRPWSLKMR